MQERKFRRTYVAQPQQAVGTGSLRVQVRVNPYAAVASVTDADQSGRRAELRDYLRAKRAALSPADVGLTSSGARRTPGLRREEVAVLAGVGVSWYTWLEQGRDIRVSHAVVTAVGRALLLDDVEMHHLRILTGVAGVIGPPSDGDIPSQVLRVLDEWQNGPALLHDEYWNVLNLNFTAVVVDSTPRVHSNLLVALFEDQRLRRMHERWAEVAARRVAEFRSSTVHLSDDDRRRAIIRGLSSRCDDFADLWAKQAVASRTAQVEQLHHPEVGPLSFDTVAVAAADRPSWTLVLQQPAAGTDTKHKLERLMELKSAVNRSTAANVTFVGDMRDVSQTRLNAS